MRDSMDVTELLRKILNETKVEEKGKKRGGPRSKLVEAILVLLLSKPLRSADIGRALGLESKYVSSYLSYWKIRGLVYNEHGLWYLTPEGEEYARQVLNNIMSTKFNEYLIIAKQILASSNIPTINYKKREKAEKRSQDFLSFIVDLKGKTDNKQERIEKAKCVLQSLQEHLTSDEQEVLKHILNHYAEWGSTYLYLDQLQEQLNADTQWIFKIIRSLQTKQLLYIYTDQRMGIRVGFSKKLKELLSAC